MGKYTLYDLIKYAEKGKDTVYITKEMYYSFREQDIIAYSKGAPMVLGMKVVVVPDLSDERLPYNSDFL